MGVERFATMLAIMSNNSVVARGARKTMSRDSLDPKRKNEGGMQQIEPNFHDANISAKYSHSQFRAGLELNRCG